MSADSPRKPRVMVSILNWNKAQETLICIESLIADTARANTHVTVVVIDNGSAAEDVALLEVEAETKRFVLWKLPENLGFTGGHNVAIRRAIEEGYDFIWLLNNDATVVPGALTKLLTTMQENSRCGAASPIIRASDDPEFVASSVNTHNWDQRTATWIRVTEEARRIQADRPESVWLVGTAIFFRTAALEQVGLLDDRMFAYFDDNDIGARLAAAGWTSRCVFDASVLHETHRVNALYPLYVYYLLQRNGMLFWLENTPRRYRRLLWLRLVDMALFDVNRLYRVGLKSQGDAALLGVRDFIFRRFGPPDLKRKVPLVLRLVCKLSAKLNEKRVLSPTALAPN